MTKNVMMYSEFSKQEYQRRREEASRIMKEHEIDGLLITTAVNIRYFAGGPLTELFEDTFNYFFLILPQDLNVEPALVMSMGREGTSKTSWIKDRRFWGYGKTGSIMDQSEWFTLLKDTLSEKGLMKGNLGMELNMGFQMGLPQVQYEKLRAALPKVKIVDCSGVIWRCRVKKSREEIEYLRRACRITCKAFQKGLDAVKPGMTEKKIASIIYESAFAQGATEKGFLALYAGERIMWGDASASEYILKKGDLLMLDGGCGVNGYRADISRMASLGKLSNLHQKQYDAVVAAHHAIIGEIKAGNSIARMCLAGKKEFVKRGFGEHLIFGGGVTGHGLGLALHELPDLRVGNNENLEEGMVLAVEPAITDKVGWNNAKCFLILENNYVVTDKGYELLTDMPEELYIIDC